MRKWIVVMALSVMLLAACAPAGGVSPVVAVEPTIDAPALNPLPLPDEAEAGAAGVVPGATRPAASPLPAQEPVSPGEVSLGDLTPTTPSAPRREAPAPGRPRGNAPDARERVMVVTAVLDLIDQLGVPAESVSVEAIEPVTWPDTSLGCAQPGVDYAQVAIDGSRITLRAGDATYTYHTDGHSRYILCRDGEIVDEGIAPVR